MGNCARCGSSFKESDGFFSDVGMVCPKCHARDEQQDDARHARDDARASDGRRGFGIGDKFTSSKSHSEVRDDGTVVTHTSTTSFDAGGPLNAVIRLIKGLFARKAE